MKRKEFLDISIRSSIAAALLPSKNIDLPKQQKTAMEKNNFQLKILATNWGFEGTLDEYCAKVKKEGYDGIEIWWPSGEVKAREELFSTLKKYELEVGFLCGDQNTDPVKHLEQFKKMTEAAARQKIQKPLYINCHSGRDHFPLEINKKFVEHTISLSKETGVKILHETHRSRIMFAAHIARQYLEKYPELKFTLDISHWCNVHESLLADQAETVGLVLERTEHIHARIGHQESPQVNDPRAPEWKEALNAHLAWWDKVIERKKTNGEVITILTEFGPPSYMPTVPYTQQPLANQWEINVHMMHLLRERYK
ncbi:MAG: sugar phosphate isomerase/epimerase [Ginsengibacter sp.]